MVPLQGDCISALDVTWKVEVTSTSSSSELIRCSQSNSEIHAYSDKAYVNDEIYIRSHTRLFIIWTLSRLSFYS